MALHLHKLKHKMKLHSELKSYIGYLTTNKKIALKGIENYNRFKNKCEPEIKEFLEKNQDIKLCFMGVFPEVGANSGIFNSINLRDFKSHLPKNMLLVSHQCKTVSLFNLNSVKIVVQNNKELFGDLNKKSLIKKYLQENQQDYFLPGKEKNTPENSIVGIKYGLLSGYPKTACLLFQNFYVEKKDNKGYIFNGKTTGSYAGFCKKHDEEFDSILSGIINRACIEYSTLSGQENQY